jgi:glycine/D-amino acid oxidase-like deaminating enzyme
MELDVGVIGAGIHGSSAAFHLASRGLRVGIFEREGPASGPTGRSSAICRAYYTNAFLATCARDSIEMFKRFPAVTGGGGADFRPTGLLFLHPPDDAARVRESAGRLRDLGIEVDLLEPDEISSRYPMFDLSGIGIGAWERNAGYADPAGATSGLFHGAVARGASPVLGHRVTGVHPEDAGGVTVDTEDGTRTRCRRVLIAAGPWTRALAAQAGVDLPLTVERHIVGVYRWGEARPAPAHGDLVGGYYFRPEGEELFLVGPVHPGPEVDPDGFETSTGQQELEELAAPVTRRVPELQGASIHGGWASLYDVSPDWQPVIGEIAPGIFVDAGTSGHGFKLAPALGRHVAALIAGEPLDPAIEEFHPRRFTRGEELDAGYGRARILG